LSQNSHARTVTKKRGKKVHRGVKKKKTTKSIIPEMNLVKEKTTQYMHLGRGEKKDVWKEKPKKRGLVLTVSRTGGLIRGPNQDTNPVGKRQFKARKRRVQEWCGTEKPKLKIWGGAKVFGGFGGFFWGR